MPEIYLVDEQKHLLKYYDLE